MKKIIKNAISLLGQKDGKELESLRLETELSGVKKERMSYLETQLEAQYDLRTADIIQSTILEGKYSEEVLLASSLSKFSSYLATETNSNQYNIDTPIPTYINKWSLKDDKSTITHHTNGVYSNIQVYDYPSAYPEILKENLKKNGVNFSKLQLLLNLKRKAIGQERETVKLALNCICGNLKFNAPESYDHIRYTCKAKMIGLADKLNKTPVFMKTDSIAIESDMTEGLEDTMLAANIEKDNFYPKLIVHNGSYYGITDKNVEVAKGPLFKNYKDKDNGAAQIINYIFNNAKTLEKNKHAYRLLNSLQYGWTKGPEAITAIKTYAANRGLEEFNAEALVSNSPNTNFFYSEYSNDLVITHKENGHAVPLQKDLPNIKGKGKRFIGQTTGAYIELFVSSSTPEKVVICEGFATALTWNSIGVDAIMIGSANNKTAVENMMKNNKYKVILALDHDMLTKQSRLAKQFMVDSINLKNTKEKYSLEDSCDVNDIPTEHRAEELALLLETITPSSSLKISAKAAPIKDSRRPNLAILRNYDGWFEDPKLKEDGTWEFVVFPCPFYRERSDGAEDKLKIYYNSEKNVRSYCFHDRCKENHVIKDYLDALGIVLDLTHKQRVEGDTPSTAKKITPSAARKIFLKESPHAYKTDINGGVYQYNPDTGVWIPLDGLSVQKLETVLFNFCESKGWGHLQTIKGEAELKHNIARAVEASGETIKATDPHLELFQDKVVRNSITGELREVTPADNFIARLSFKYAPDATCPTFMTFLDTTFDDSEGQYEDKKGTIEFLRMAAQYTLSNASIKDTELVPFLLGSGNNGKNVFIDLIRSMFPSYAVCNLDPSEWDASKPKIGILRNKRLNIVGDQSTGNLTGDSFKSVVSGDTIDVDVKYKNAISFEPIAKHWVLTNKLPNTKDHSDGYYNRFAIVPFNNTFNVGDPKRIHGLKRLLAKELSGIYNWIIKGATEKPIKLGEYMSKDMKNELDKYRGTTDSLAAFFKTNTIIHNSRKESFSVVTGNALYKHYEEYMKADGGIKTTRRNFLDEAERRIPGVTYGKYKIGSGPDAKRKKGYTISLVHGDLDLG